MQWNQVLRLPGHCTQWNKMWCQVHLNNGPEMTDIIPHLISTLILSGCFWRGFPIKILYGVLVSSKYAIYLILYIFFDSIILTILGEK
jgi:hypothetical protein